jgi:uncharacterized protein (DUF58 family)
MAETKEILKKVRKIEIKTKCLVEGLLQGAYHSIFKGRGIEFSEVREYVPGDDIRAIDWNVTARFNQPFVKEFIEERDLTVYIALDVSASSEFGREKSKKDMAIELSASIMFAALKNSDKIGLCMFTDKVEKFIPPRKGKKHILKAIREMVEYTPKNKATDLNEPLRFMSKVIKRRSIIFIISDFFTESEFDKNLRILKNKHDVIAVNLNDLREMEMPDIGYIELEDEETGEQILVNTSDDSFRKTYSNLMKARHDSLIKKFRRLNIDSVDLKSDESFEIPLRKFFRLREKRMVR